MEFSHYFTPFDQADAGESTIGAGLTLYSDSLDCRDFDIAIIAVPEYRYEEAEVLPIDFNRVISETSRLFVHGYEPNVLAMGVLKIGEQVKDTEAGLAEVVEQLLQCKAIPLILGGSRDLTYGVYKAFDRQEQIVNFNSIDITINLDESAAHPYIGRIIKEQPNYLFNYSNIGFQTYFVSPEELGLCEELFFDAYRLGMVRGNVPSVEPVIRSAEVTSISIDTIRVSDCTASLQPQPNGFSGEEICQMLRYVGLAEKSKAVVISDLVHTDKDNDFVLLAEMIWCFVDGYYSRKAEIPGSNKDGYLKYRVPIRNDEFQLVFYKSVQTDRWWMEVPVPPQYANKYRKHHLVACGYDDYITATRDDLPERWWKAYKKML